MPPKNNQFKQGHQPAPKKATATQPKANPLDDEKTSDGQHGGGAEKKGYLPMHLLLRTANKVMLQTVVPSSSKESSVSSPGATASSPLPSSSVSSSTQSITPSTGLSGSPPPQQPQPQSVDIFSSVDCSECDIVVTRDGNVAVIATANDVRVVNLRPILAKAVESSVSSAAAAEQGENNNNNNNTNNNNLQFVTLAEEKICHMMLSPLETFLVVYRMRDPKRPNAGNMAIYNLADIIAKNFTTAINNNNNNNNNKNTKTTSPPASGVPVAKPIMKCVQGAWPALAWTPNEAFCVRYARGLLILHEGFIGSAGDDTDDDNDENKEQGVEATTTTTTSNAPRFKMELQLPQNKEPVFETPPIIIPSGGVGGSSTATDSISSALDQQAAKLPPIFALFKPHNKNQLATLGFYRLPMFREPQFQIQLQRAEGAQLEWSRNATHVCVISKQEPERGDNSYYAKTSLVLVNIGEKKDLVVKFPGVATVGSGVAYEAVHDVKWSPVRDEFIVIHGMMPRNKATLYNDKGQPLFQFGEAPRNLSAWSPDGAMFVLGGTGSLVGEFQFYNREGLGDGAQQGVGQAKKTTVGGSSSSSQSHRMVTGRPGTAPPTATPSSSSSSSSAVGGGKLGSFNEKSSEQTWSPDSRHMLCATVFGKLRIDNKFFIYKHNGERTCEVKFKTDSAPVCGSGAGLASSQGGASSSGGGLYQAMWVPRPAGHYGPHRTPSPTVAAAVAPKPALFKARGAGNAAISAALSRAPLASSSGAYVAARPAGLLPGENPVQQKPKRR